VISNTAVTRVSYNGGNGGIDRRPGPQEEAAARERHLAPVAVQTQHAQAARANPEQRASVNLGKPAVAATPRPGDLKDRAVVQAKAAGAPYTPRANRGGNQPRDNGAAPRPENNAARPSTPVHPRDLPPAARPSVPSTGNPKQDQKYQQQQEKQIAKQEQERQKLQQQQQKEDQQLETQHTDAARKQQVEQQHQQQTQQLQQRHQQQLQQLQQKQQPAKQSKPPQ
jgi:hypothetical protein